MVVEQLYSPHAEEATIGACILQPDVLPECRRLLRTDDFHDHRLRWIWDSLCRLADAGVFVDTLTICKDLETHHQLLEVGGLAFITKLLTEPPSSMNAPEYAHIVARDGTRRRITTTLGEISRRTYIGDQDPTEIIQFAKAQLEETDHAYNLQADFSKRFNLYTAFDALQPQPPIVWRVEKLFRECGVYVVYGAPGSKKTYAMLDLAVSVALGTKWLGLQTDQSPVLIVDEESGPRRMAERLGATLRGHMASEGTPITYVSLDLVDLRNKNDAMALRGLIEYTHAKFVIIDALADVMPGADENSVGETQPIFLILRKLAQETCAAIIVIHHANKGAGGARGSSAIVGATDLLLKVISPPGQELITFELEKPRDVGKFTFAAIAKFGDGDFYLVETDPPKVQQEVSKEEELEADILAALEDGAMSTNKLRQKVKVNKSKLLDTVDRLVIAGRLSRAAGPNQSIHYSIMP